LANLFGPSGFIAPKHFLIIWLCNLSVLSVADEDYYGNALYALNLIFLLLFFLLYKNFFAGGTRRNLKIIQAIESH